MDNLIDLKPILGEPVKLYEFVKYNNMDEIEYKTITESINPEFVANGILFLFILVLTGNILLRTIFPKQRR